MALYKEAGLVIDGLRKGKSNIKGLIYSSKFPNKKALYGLVSRTLEYSSVILELLQECPKFKKEHQNLSEGHQWALVQDLLFGGGIKGGGKLMRSILSYRTTLQAALDSLLQKKGVASVKALLPKAAGVTLSRHVRVNTLKISFEDVLAQFQEEGYTLVNSPLPVASKNGKAASPKSKFLFHKDEHIDNLLVFNSSTDFHMHNLLHEGAVVLQDKASCMPAHILGSALKGHFSEGYPDSWGCIDACAAPGNKTSHLSATLDGQGQIFAFDRDEKRLLSLQRNMAKFGCENVKAVQADFLQVQPTDKQYANVVGMLVDPSCSGSGIIHRGDACLPTSETAEEKASRLDHLANFQVSAVTHAMSFPSAQFVVYSTCSVHEEENEDVVRRVLETHGTEFEVIEALPTWPTRGLDRYPFGAKCVRADPYKDDCIGFFVTCFQRRGKSKADLSLKRKRVEVENDLSQTKKKKKSKKKKKNSQNKQKNKLKKERRRLQEEMAHDTPQ